MPLTCKALSVNEPPVHITVFTVDVTATTLTNTELVAEQLFASVVVTVYVEVIVGDIA